MPEPQGSPDTLTPGAAVRVSGIQSRPELNGQRGVCVQYDEKKGRWDVRLDDGEVVSLKEISLTAIVAIPVTSLIKAAEKGHMSEVDALLAARADANAIMSDGVTPLMMAAREGHLGVVDAVLAARADPNPMATNGGTALMMAARAGWPEVMNALIEHKADVHTQSHGTALHKAAAPTPPLCVFVP